MQGYDGETSTATVLEAEPINSKQKEEFEEKLDKDLNEWRKYLADDTFQKMVRNKHKHSDFSNNYYNQLHNQDIPENEFWTIENINNTDLQEQYLKEYLILEIKIRDSVRDKYSDKLDQSLTCSEKCKLVKELYNNFQNIISYLFDNNDTYTFGIGHNNHIIKKLEEFRNCLC